MRIESRLRALGTVLLVIAVVAVSAAAGATSKRPTRGQRATVAKARAMLHRNLIANGDAEIEEDGHASGWLPAGVLESEAYGHTAGEWESGVNSGPGAGERYFRLPIPDGEESIVVEQWISVAAESARVDRNIVSYTLSGRFGGLEGDPGTTVLSASFLDASGAELGAVATDPVRSAQLPKPEVGSAALAERVREGEVPAGTRRVHVTLAAQHLGFKDCPNCSALGLADQLSLVLSLPTPRHD